MSGYESCLANLETSEWGGEAANALWDLVPDGEFSIFTNYLWAEVISGNFTCDLVISLNFRMDQQLIH